MPRDRRAPPDSVRVRNLQAPVTAVTTAAAVPQHRRVPVRPDRVHTHRTEDTSPGEGLSSTAAISGHGSSATCGRPVPNPGPARWDPPPARTGLPAAAVEVGVVLTLLVESAAGADGPAGHTPAHVRIWGGGVCGRAPVKIAPGQDGTCPTAYDRKRSPGKHRDRASGQGAEPPSTQGPACRRPPDRLWAATCGPKASGSGGSVTAGRQGGGGGIGGGHLILSFSSLFIL